MKLNVKKLWILIALLWASILASAYDFKVDGISYNIISDSDNQVEVHYVEFQEDRSYIIPSSVEYNGLTYSVVSIGKKVLHYSGATSVFISEGVITISESAFEGCSDLVSVSIPGSVISIGERAFCHCASLTSVSISEGVTSIGNFAFANCSALSSVLIPASVSIINGSVFYKCDQLTEINVASNSDYFVSYDGILYDRSMTTIIAAPKVLSSITLPATLSKIGDYAFSGSSITSIEIPHSVNSIGDYAFESCKSLSSIVFPDNVVRISEGTLEWCEKLKTVTIPEAVAVICGDAFHGCEAVETIYNKNPYPQIYGDRSFGGVPFSMIVYVPKGSFRDYKNFGWGSFAIKEMDFDHDNFGEDEKAVFNIAVATPSQGIVEYEYPANRDVKFSVEAPSGWQLDAVIFNGNHLAEDHKGMYSTGKLTEDSVIDIIYKQIGTGIDEAGSDTNKIEVYCRECVLHINGTSELDFVTVCAEDGKLLFSGYSNEVPLQNVNGTVIVNIADKGSYKLIVR